MAANVVKVAQSQLEWLRDTLMRVFDHTRENPFACRREQLASHLRGCWGSRIRAGTDHDKTDCEG